MHFHKYIECFRKLSKLEAQQEGTLFSDIRDDFIESLVAVEEIRKELQERLNKQLKFKDGGKGFSAVKALIAKVVKYMSGVSEVPAITSLHTFSRRK